MWKVWKLKEKGELILMKNPDWLTMKECCEWIDVSLQKLYDLRRDGLIPEFSIGKSIYFSKKAIDEMVQSNMRFGMPNKEVAEEDI